MHTKDIRMSKFPHAMRGLCGFRTSNVHTKQKGTPPCRDFAYTFGGPRASTARIYHWFYNIYIHIYIYIEFIECMCLSGSVMFLEVSRTH